MGTVSVRPDDARRQCYHHNSLPHADRQHPRPRPKSPRHRRRPPSPTAGGIVPIAHASHHHGPRPFLRLRRQIGHVPAPRLAARRDGRPHARLRADPRRHHGRRRRLHALPRLSAAAPFRRRHDHHRLHRLLHRHLRRAHRRPAKRHQAHPRLLDPLAARLHGHGRRLRRPRRRDVPPHHPRLLQGAPLPRRRLRHPRPARRAGHLENGRPRAKKIPAHLLDLPHRHARPERLPAFRRLLQQGLHPLRRLRAQSRSSTGSASSPPSSPPST